jgi:DNA-directed RNA polymerase subunit alpha
MRACAKIVAEPLERGFGMTLGNALRRILLSSCRARGHGGADRFRAARVFVHQGRARRCHRHHAERQEIALRMEGEGPKRMIVRKQGPGIVTAGDIQTVGDIE